MFETDSVYCQNGDWYFAAPEGDFGPFATQIAARQALENHEVKMSSAGNVVQGVCLNKFSLDQVTHSDVARTRRTIVSEKYGDFRHNK